MKTRWRQAAGGALLGGVLAFGAGCNSPQGDGSASGEGDLSEEERAKFVAEICDIHCGSYMDTECNPAPPDEKLFATMQECLDSCVAIDYGPPSGPGYWTDGENNCGPENVAQAQCVASLSCSERKDIWYNPDRRHESACAEVAIANGKCRLDLARGKMGKMEGDDDA